jgi:uncharacterized membrane protein YesL
MSQVKESKFLAASGTIATYVVLNVCFLIACLGVITVLPAAVALQRTLPAKGEDLPSRPARDFVSAFRQAWRQGWPLGCALPFLAVGGFVAVFFYLASAPAVGIPALLVLVPLLSLATAGYLALLEAARRHTDGNWRSWSRSVPSLLLARPLQAAAAVLLLATAAALASRLPTLLPIGCGIAPALIVRWSFGPRSVVNRRELRA